MPCYTYLCSKCENKFEIVCSIREYKENVKCESCGSKNTSRCYHDDLSTLNTSVRLSDSEIKTIGHLANRNSERMSDDQKIALYKKHNSYKDEAPKKELPSGMSRMKKSKGKIKWNTE
jgi:putative FmdB family regulatory protein